MDTEGRSKPSMMSLRLDEDVQESLRARAEARGLPASAAVREAIELWLTMQDEADRMRAPDTGHRPRRRRDDLVQLKRERLGLESAKARLAALKEESRDLMRARDHMAEVSLKAQHEMQALEAELKAAEQARREARNRHVHARERIEMTRQEVRKSFAERELLERRVDEIAAMTAELTRLIEARSEAPQDPTSREEKGGIW